MTARPHQAVWLIPFVFIALSVLLSAFALRVRPAATGRAAAGGGPPDIRLVLSRRPDLVFGFRNFMADVTWLEAVQVAGARRMARSDYDRLDSLVSIVNGFDPRFLVPYLLGGLILSDSPEHTGRAIAVLERGEARHPNEWRLPFYIGYIRYFSEGDPEAGARALEKAARLPGSPLYLSLLAARMYAEGRKPETALSFLDRLIEQEPDPGRRAALLRRRREVVVERDVQSLERAVEEYRRSHGGAVPATLEELVEAGLIRRVPAEPHGGRYVILPDGSVRSDRVAGRLKVFRAGGRR